MILTGLALCITATAISQTSTTTATPELPVDVKQDWYNLDFQQDGLYGTSANRTFSELVTTKQPQKQIVVAVLDSGVEVDHDDLEESIWTNPGEIPGNGVDDDNNGYIDDVHGWNFITDSNGKDVQYANLEATRVLRLAKEIEENGGTKPAWLTDAMVARAEEIYSEYEEEYNSGKAIAEFYHVIDSVLVAALRTENYTFEQAMRIAGKPLQKILKSMIKAGMTRSDLVDFVEQNEMFGAYYINYDYISRTYLDTSDHFYGNNSYEGPDADHGTHVAGIIASDRDNKIGGRGIAYGSAVIMVVRVVPDGDEEDVDVANAIRYAVDNGANIINMSFGKGISPYSEIVGAALKYASDHNVLVIHAAGNDSDNCDEVDNYPDPKTAGSKADLSYITVGASSYDKKALVTDFSNYGPQSVDLFAPGEDIWSTVPDDGAQFNSGTSMAAPVVSGVAALIWSYFPDLTANQLKEILLESATKPAVKKVSKPGTTEKVPLASLSKTGGIVNAYAAFEMAGKMAD